MTGVLSKVCTGCSIDKPLGDFPKSPRGRHGKHSKCKPCRRAIKQDWYSRTRDERIASMHRWYARRGPEHRREWRKKNPHAAQAIKNNRRARERQAEGTFTAEEFKALGDTCMHCGRNDVPMTVDHIIPLSKGGTNYIDNIQPLCRSCNCRKGNREA